jgi:hypothetical protein
VLAEYIGDFATLENVVTRLLGSSQLSEKPLRGNLDRFLEANLRVSRNTEGAHFTGRML